MTNEKSDKLFVRSDYITRCRWCGTPYSPEWVSTQSGRIYCSTECQSAEQSGCGKVGGSCSIVIGLIIVMMAFISALLNPGVLNSVAFAVFTYAGFFILSGFCILAQAIEGSTYKDRKDRYRDSQLMVCEYCNHIPPPGTVVCDNCGASLADADFSSDPWPEWFVPPKPTKIFGPCRNCGRSFVYPVLSADGRDRCPKCGNPV
ncbi:MAG: hypothetical protein ACFFBL_07520 [Promethearchaeota archaeon]